MLVRQAIDVWHLPALIFRPTSISGDTQSGFSNIRDSISIILSGVAKLGTFLFFFYYTLFLIL